MRVLCIDASNYGNGDCPELVEGGIYTVIETFNDFYGALSYVLLEVKSGCERNGYRAKRFIPLQEQETEVETLELETVNQ